MFTSITDRSAFAERLREVIKEKNLTQRAAAEALGMFESQLSRYLIGQIPEPGKLLQIAQWADCSMEWLLTGQDPARLQQRPPSATINIENATMGILYLTLHDKNRAWKAIDWDLLNRLYKAGFIYDPVGKQKSIQFTDKGLSRAKRMYEQLFQKSP